MTLFILYQIRKAEDEDDQDIEDRKWVRLKAEAIEEARKEAEIASHKLYARMIDGYETREQEYKQRILELDTRNLKCMEEKEQFQTQVAENTTKIRQLEERLSNGG